MSDKHDLYKFVELKGIYNFLVLSLFSFEIVKMLEKNNIEF